MDDQRFGDLINAEHEELSDDEHSEWLTLQYKLKYGRSDRIQEND
jgi:hypothetical protein